MKSCSTCRQKAAIDDIRIVLASKIVVTEDSDSRQMEKELDRLEKIIENLRRLGIEYVECEICKNETQNS